jgi:LuxR family maltose regulon positive regulatory protein
LQRLEDRAQTSGAHLLSLAALTQQILFVLGTPHEAAAKPLLNRALQAATGGALLPFQRLIRQHPDWLREQLQPRKPCLLVQFLLTTLPASTCARDIADSSHSTDHLSAREMSVLQLIAQGCSNQEISERLFISLHTVKTHASHINSKLGVERRTQAVARAQELGLLG